MYLSGLAKSWSSDSYSGGHTWRGVIPSTDVVSRLAPSLTRKQATVMKTGTSWIRLSAPSTYSWNCISKAHYMTYQLYTFILTLLKYGVHSDRGFKFLLTSSRCSEVTPSVSVAPASAPYPTRYSILLILPSILAKCSAVKPRYDFLSKSQVLYYKGVQISSIKKGIHSILVYCGSKVAEMIAAVHTGCHVEWSVTIIDFSVVHESLVILQIHLHTTAYVYSTMQTTR